eukprot:scaffold19061_cov71-Phaeocystis_antarctica.AAC.1
MPKCTVNLAVTASHGLVVGFMVRAVPRGTARSNDRCAHTHAHTTHALLSTYIRITSLSGLKGCSNLVRTA